MYETEINIPVGSSQIITCWSNVIRAANCRILQVAIFVYTIATCLYV